MHATRSYPVFCIALTLVAVMCFTTGCRQPRSMSTPPAPGSPGTPTMRFSPVPIVTADINDFDRLIKSQSENDGTVLASELRKGLLAKRWLAMQRAVVHHGTTHRDAFYASRAYWHTRSTRGLSWALEHNADLSEPFYIDGKGDVLIHGDVNADIEVSGNATVHILGDLNATLELKGVCEVVIAGSMSKDATIICDGQLELFVAGNTAGIFGATGSATMIIDGTAAGVIQCGAPATTLTITGDLKAQLAAPANNDAILTLRVDGYASSAAMADLADAGFTRVNATLGRSDTVPGLYPAGPQDTRPTTRWVVLQQRKNDQ